MLAVAKNVVTDTWEILHTDSSKLMQDMSGKIKIYH